MVHVVRLIQVPALAGHHSRRTVYAVFVFLASGVSIGVITAVAYWSGHPLVVPSLGPTAFLVFNRSQSSVARPRNIVLGHLVGALAGYASLVAFGLQHAPSVVDGGLTAPRIGAAALSIALTSAAMILLNVEHGPAGATTLIVSLGFLTTPGSLILLMAGVVFLAVLGVLIDRSVGLQLPYWAGPGTGSSSRSLKDRLPRLVATPRANGDGRLGAPGPPSQRSLRDGGPDWLVAPGEGHPVLVGSERCRLKVQDARATGAYSLLEVTLEPSLPSTLLHAHYDFAESYFVLDGSVVAEVGAERKRAAAGSTICVPAGVPHVLNAAGRQTARLLCVTDRARHSDLEYLP